MRSFNMMPAGTGSTSKSHKSHSLSISSSTASSTATSMTTSIVSSSLSHAKHATSAAWSACKNGTRTTLKRGSSALHISQKSQSQSQTLDWNQGQPQNLNQRRRVRRLFHLGGTSTKSSKPNNKSRYRSLSEDTDTDDDDRDIFSGRPFRESAEIRQKEDNDDHGNDESESAAIARFVYTPQHAAASYLATSTARHMQFAADEGDGDDDEWWRD